MIRLPYPVGVRNFMSRCVTVSLQFLAVANMLIANAPTCTEARSVVRGRQADQLSKDLPECSGVLISHRPGNFFHRKCCKLQQFAGFLYFQVLHVFSRGEACSFSKSA
jgi:hypothetical protein